MKVLVFAPHSDDEVLGVGGTIAKHCAQGDEVYVCIVTKGAEPLFDKEPADRVIAEAVEAHKVLGVMDTIFLNFPAAMLETVPRYELNRAVLQVVTDSKPDVVYLPHAHDMQRDHGLVSEAAMVALRPKHDHVVKKIYAYETLSETEWSIPNAANAFVPTVWNDISGFLDMKIKAMKQYKSQLGEFPNPRSLEAIESLAKLRGSTVLVKAAEAFVVIREIRC